MTTHTERLSTGGRVYLRPASGGGTTILVQGHVRCPEVHDPRPIREVAEQLTRDGLTVIEVP